MPSDSARENSGDDARVLSTNGFRFRAAGNRICRWLLSTTLGLLVVACNGRAGTVLSVRLDDQLSGSAPVSIRKQDLYSISLKCVVTDSASRRVAWRLFEFMHVSKELGAQLEVTRKGDGEILPIEMNGDPKLSSWNDRELDVEFARVRLEPGKYEIRYALQVRRAADMPCEMTLDMGSAYVGK